MIHLEFFGAHLGVQASAECGEQIEALWSPFVRAPANLPAEATLLDVTGTLPQALSAFAVAVNAFALEACPDLATHAGVLDIGGMTLALPGTSGVGKSTLTAACLQAGMGYVSDEALCLPYDSDDVRGYPRPFALSPWSMAALGFDAVTSSADEGVEFIVAPSVLGDICVAPGPLRHIVVPTRTAGAIATLSPLHRADITALLTRLSFNHYRRPEDAFELIVRTVRVADVWQLRYSNPTAAAQLLVDRLC